MVLVTHGSKAQIIKHLQRESYPLFGFLIDDNVLNSDNIWAFFIVIYKTPQTMAFVEKWLSLCENPRVLVDGPIDELIQDSTFEWHQHDQSILSVLAAKNPNKIHLIPRNHLRKKYGIHNMSSTSRSRMAVIFVDSSWFSYLA